MSATETIVVGVDGSPSSVQALEWAIGQAKLTGAAIEAVTAWHIPNTYGAPLPSGDDYGAIAVETLDKAIADARNARTGPGDERVVIGSFVAEGNAAEILADRARHARLLVVGNRGHNGLSEALLGSVSQYLVHHAPCPVVVIRDGAVLQDEAA
jgi:nucleotide-binding universal stress UspA family protein